MKTFLIFGILLCLIGIFLQDWKYRKIHVLLPVVIFILLFNATFLDVKNTWMVVLYNCFFFCLVFGIMVMYMTMKRKKITNPFKQYFGLGDFVFYIAVTPVFILKNYILFFIGSLLFSIIAQFVLSKIVTRQSIPLAGFSALFLAIILFIDITHIYKSTLL